MGVGTLSKIKVYSDKMLDAGNHRMYTNFIHDFALDIGHAYDVVSIPGLGGRLGSLFTINMSTLVSNLSQSFAVKSIQFSIQANDAQLGAYVGSSWVFGAVYIMVPDTSFVHRIALHSTIQSQIVGNPADVTVSGAIPITCNSYSDIHIFKESDCDPVNAPTVRTMNGVIHGMMTNYEIQPYIHSIGGY